MSPRCPCAGLLAAVGGGAWPGPVIPVAARSGVNMPRLTSVRSEGHCGVLFCCFHLAVRKEPARASKHVAQSSLTRSFFPYGTFRVLSIFCFRNF